MTIQHRAHQERIDAGLGFEWDLLPAWTTSVASCPSETELLRLCRDKNYFLGLENLRSLKTLWTYGVNQAFLDTICATDSLETLSIDKVTAKDFSELAKLSRLKTLVIENASGLQTLDWLPSCHQLRRFSIENCVNVQSIDPVSFCTKLTALGLEGGMWKPMKVSTLAPLAGLESLTHIFITNLVVGDGSLQALKGIKQLQVIQCANFFSAEEFADLASALPSLTCDWFPFARSPSN